MRFDFTGNAAAEAERADEAALTQDRDHDCREHLVYRSHEWEERHGLDCGPYEHCFEEWWQCAICGEKYTEKELKDAF